MAVFVADAIDQYLLALRAARASQSTIRVYGFMLKRLETFARLRGYTRVDELTLDVVRGAIAECMGDPVADTDKHGPNWKGGEGSAYSMAGAVKSFSAALRADGVGIADFSSIRVPQPPERIQPRITPEEFRALEEAVLRRLMASRAPRLLVARDLALLSFMADTGLRAGEICALDIGDVDLVEGTVTVKRGKGSKPRILNIRDADGAEQDGGPTLRALRDYLEHRKQAFAYSRQRALWLTRRGNRLSPSSLRDDLAKLCDEAGIEGTRPPHAFRRGYFSAEYRSRPTSLPILRARMGWSPRSHSMVGVYTRGAEIDLSREHAMHSVSKRWRNGGASTAPRRVPEQATLEAILELLQRDRSLSVVDLHQVLGEALRQGGGAQSASQAWAGR